jgi:protein involved in polysaccharide export with SLBB domain
MYASRNLLLTFLLANAGILTAQNSPEPPRPLAVDTASYEIGPKDLLQIDVWGHADISKLHRVRPDGRITLPYGVGDVMAEGITPERLSAHVAEALKAVINEPSVGVSVIEVQSKAYTVSGAAARPGPYPMPVPVRVFEAINNAGGFSSVFAKKKEVLVIGEDGKDRRTFDFEAYTKGKNMEKNVNFVLKNGDTVFVKE